jgi:uncharacterized membrane protein
MITVKKLILLFSIFSVILFLSSETVYAKSYSYSYIKMFLNPEKDGSVIVSQERTYDFQGSFTWAYLDLKKKGSSDIDFIEIRDLDNNQAVNFNIEEDNSHVKATWYYSANNQVKRFLITYKIKDAIKRYEDVADFYWKVIEDDHEYIKNFNADVNLPEPSPNLFKLFVHSDSNPGTMDFSNDSKTVSVSMQDIPKNTFVEFRVLTEPTIFTGVQQTSEKRYSTILDEEKRIFESGKTYPFDNSLIIVVTVIIVIPIIVFLYFYLKYGVEPKVDYGLKYEPEPPRDIPPMALSALYGNDLRNSARGLLATIFDLARRGYIDIREEKKEHLLGLVEKTEQIFKITKKGRDELSSKSSLHGFEDDVLRLLFEDMSEKKDEISSSEMVKWCKWHTTAIRDTVSTLNKDAKDWFETKYFKLYEPRSLKEGSKFMAIMLFYGLFAFVVLALSNFFPVDFHLLIIAIMVVVVIGLIAMNAIKRKTPESTLEIKKWNAFKSYISDFSAMKDAPTTLLHIWDRYLVYAVVLDVAKQLLENVKNLSLERNAPVAAVVWYHPIGAPGVPAGMMSPESFSAFSSNMNSMITALSSSSSVGGGFSGGGGGGGGGGGSGAG